MDEKVQGNQPLGNLREEIFAACVAAGYPLVQASVAAGYRPCTASSSRRARLPRVAKRIEEHRLTITDGTEIRETELRAGVARAWQALSYLCEHATSESARVNAARFVLIVTGHINGGARADDDENPQKSGLKTVHRAIDEEAKHIHKLTGIPVDQLRRQIEERTLGNVATLRKTTA